MQKPIRVIEFPSGYRILTNGHHRSAALVQAARKGIVPENLPREVPVELLKVGPDFPIPESVFLQIFAPAHELTLDDLLPLRQ